jgi:undecaprenyl phosphate N,N'-diacetylbacillosamine 1-phosphate transferase
LKQTIYKSIVKRFFDLLLSMAGLIVLFPVLLVVPLVLIIANGGYPFFIQPRPGKNSRVFKIIKFKTMNDKKDIHGDLLPDAERLTTFGKFIRKTSLDEIPQLINVLKGEMSLIGPRPLLVEYLDIYTDFQNRRHEVKPGITGWTQVNGRNSISWNEKFILDVWYVDNMSFLLDLKILWLTAYKVLKSEGINQANQATMEKFTKMK